MKSMWTRLVLVGVLATSVYFAHVEWQTRLGREAIAATELQFQSLDAALLEAKTRGKPVLVDFSAIWCPSCRRMHAELFTDPSVKAAIRRGYVLAMVDYESAEAPAFMQRYQVSGFPSLLVLQADGALSRKLPLTFDPVRFLSVLDTPG